jgi:hypothetical protein
MSLIDYAKIKMGLNNNGGNVPLGLHPGTIIQIKDVPLIFADAAGSIIKDIKKDAKIETLGFYKQGDITVFRAYFDDDNCFVEVPVKDSEPMKPIHLRLFKTMNEDYPDKDLRDLLLGKDDNDEPLIGWFQFKFNDTGTIYDRSWMSGTNVSRSVRPFHLKETLMDKTKKEIQYDTHDIMLYQRELSDTLTEYLYTDFVLQRRSDGQEGEVFRTFIGIDISDSDINILPSTT